jgi:hypothetical protein
MFCAGIIWGGSTPTHLQIPDGSPEIDQAINRFKKGEHDRCSALLNAAAATNPDFPPGQLMYAKLCLLMDQPAQGRAALERSIAENPGLAPVSATFLNW